MTFNKRNIVWKDNFSLWSDIVKKSPNKARPYNNLGLALFYNNDLDKALVEFRQALRLNPRSEKAYLKAIETYRKVLGLEPANVRAKDRIEKISKELIW